MPHVRPLQLPCTSFSVLNGRTIEDSGRGHSFLFSFPPRSFACSFCLAADKTVGTVVGIERRGVSSVSWIFRISNMNGRSASKVSTEATASILALPPKGHCWPGLQDRPIARWWREHISFRVKRGREKRESARSDDENREQLATVVW